MLLYIVTEMQYHVSIFITLYTVYHQSRSGFIAVCTSTLIIFGSYSSSMYPAVCVEAVEKLGKGD